MRENAGFQWFMLPESINEAKWKDPLWPETQKPEPTGREPHDGDLTVVERLLQEALRRRDAAQSCAPRKVLDAG